MLKIIIFLLSFLLSGTALAEDMSIYETEVEVDAAATDAAAAREKAMSEANRKALYAVINRISAASSTELLDKLNDNQILNFIREVSVVSEKVTNSRYLASLKITINAPVLKSYLQEKNAPITILPESHILILPVYRESAASLPSLWEENNLWRTAWLDNETTTGQITVTVAADTAQNRSRITAEDASVLNRINLQSISRMTDMSDIYTAEAVSSGNGFSATLKSPTYGVVLSREGTDKSPETFAAVIADMKSAIMQKIQEQALSEQTAQNSLTIVFNFNNLREWLALQKALKNIKNINKINTDAMSGRSVQITLDYTGSLTDLQDKFFEQGLRLTEDNNFYTVERI